MNRVQEHPPLRTAIREFGGFSDALKDDFFAHSSYQQFLESLIKDVAKMTNDVELRAQCIVSLLLT